MFQNRWERRVDLSGYLRELQMVGLQYGWICWMAFRGWSEAFDCTEHSFLTIKSVGVTGNRTRYHFGMYISTWQSGQFVKLSGTAIIRIYYRLKLRLEAVFYFIGEIPIGSKSYHVLFLLRKYRDKKRRKKDEKKSISNGIKRSNLIFKFSINLP